MSKFKEVIDRDIEHVFLNTEEFADMHTINGVPMPVLVDYGENVEREKRFSHHIDGISAELFYIYVKGRRLPELPRRGSWLEFDGHRYMVSDARDEAGMYVIALDASVDIEGIGSVPGGGYEYL